MSKSNPKPDAAAPPPILDANTLFKDQKEIRLAYGGEIYRLRITRNQKLILTK